MQFLTDFLYNLGGAIYIFILHGVFFFILFFATEKNTSGGFANFRRADSDDPFITPHSRLEFYYYLFNKIITNVLLTFITAILTITILEHYFAYHIFATQIQEWPFALQVIVGLLIADAAFFFPHWFSHKFLWRFHSIHHSAEKLSWTTALRLHPVDQIPFAVGGAVVMYALGFEGQSIVLAFIIHDIYNLFVHANLSLDYPKPFCYILGSPNYHRWHHAAEKEAIDKNLATMFPVFDLIFGTYYYPRGRLPKSYGLHGKAQQAFPKTFGEQLLYPFRKKKDGAR